MVSFRSSHSSPLHSQRGFSMIEVLVTMFIVTLALLGTAGLQAYSMRLNQGGQFRTQAVFLASDLAERMEANKTAAITGAYAVAESGTAVAPSSACLAGQPACSPPALALFDLAQWENAVSSTLPQSSWQVVNVAGNPATITITISWVDRLTEKGNAAAGTGNAAYDATIGTGINAAGTGERFRYTATRTVFTN
jgi:type IV pilus assembly protein PilV